MPAFFFPTWATPFSIAIQRKQHSLSIQKKAEGKWGEQDLNPAGNPLSVILPWDKNLPLQPTKGKQPPKRNGETEKAPTSFSCGNIVRRRDEQGTLNWSKQT